MASSSAYPVVVIHAAVWCGACKQLLAPESFEKLTKMVKAINPRTQIKVVYHKDFKTLNRTDEYPPIASIPEFPLITVTSSANCTKRGTMGKVEVFKYKWNGSSLVPAQPESHNAFFNRAINVVMGNAVVPVVDPPVHRSTPSRTKTERKERPFRLIGISES